MIGLFGGTFDPVHFGHIHLSLSLKELWHLDEVWVVPANVSPFRTNEKLADGNHRLQMAKLAFEEIEGFSVLDLDIQRGGTSYMIDTIEALGVSDMVLMLGEDALTDFMLWKRAKDILKRVRLLVGKRPGTSSIPPELSADVVEIPQIEISATEVRERLKKKLYCGHLVPAKVLDYLYEYQLYFVP